MSYDICYGCEAQDLNLKILQKNTHAFNTDVILWLIAELHPAHRNFDPPTACGTNALEEFYQ
jgi:hypothetical protein